MDIWTLESMNEGTMAAIELTARIFLFSAVACFVSYLACTAWLCLEETRRSTRRRTMPAPTLAAPAISSRLLQAGRRRGLAASDCPVVAGHP
jgi:hypothetical protein